MRFKDLLFYFVGQLYRMYYPSNIFSVVVFLTLLKYTGKFFALSNYILHKINNEAQ